MFVAVPASCCNLQMKLLSMSSGLSLPLSSVRCPLNGVNDTKVVVPQAVYSDVTVPSPCTRITCPLLNTMTMELLKYSQLTGYAAWLTNRGLQLANSVVPYRTCGTPSLVKNMLYARVEYRYARFISSSITFHPPLKPRSVVVRSVLGALILGVIGSIRTSQIECSKTYLSNCIGI